MNIKSASRIALSISVEKNRFLPRHCFTISSRPGCEDESKGLKSFKRNKSSLGWPKLLSYFTSKIGNFSEFHASILGLLKSTTVTLISGHFSAMTLHVGPPTQPAPIQQIALMEFISSRNLDTSGVSNVVAELHLISVYSRHFQISYNWSAGYQTGIPLLKVDWLVSLEARGDLGLRQKRRLWTTDTAKCRLQTAVRG